MIGKETYSEYLKRGWSVIPWKLIEGEDGKFYKKPAISSWREYQKRFATEDEIESWDNKYNAIAVITGSISNLTVVDVDTSNKESVPFKELNSPITVKSAFSGGKHYYYKYCDDARTTSKIADSPIDIRSDGGLIILPPSGLGKKKYTFEKNSPNFLLDEVPEDVLSALEVRNKELSTPVGDDLPEVFEGNRDDMATRVAGSLFARIPFGLADEVILPALLEWNRNKVNPPLHEQDILKVFRSIKQAQAIHHPEAILSPNDFGAPKDLNFIATQRKREHLLEASAPSTGIFGLDQIIKGFLPGHLYTMTGETNVGKTSLCCNFAYNVASQGRRVLYFALEPGNTIVDYLASVKERDTFENAREKIFDISNKIEVFTDGVNNVGSLKNIVNSLGKYDLIIVDHISYFITGQENYIQEQSNAIKALFSLAKTRETAVLLVAHINKKSSSKGEIDYNSISGSAAFKQDSSEVLIVTKEEDDSNHGIINVAKTKTGPNGICPIRFYEGSAYISEGEILNVDFGKKQASSKKVFDT